MRKSVLVGLALVVLLAGCRSAEEVIDPDTQFGHRPDTPRIDDRQVLEIRPPAPGEEYFVFPAHVTDLMIRRAPSAADGRRSVDLRIEGSLPDTCTSLHSLEEDRLGNLIDVTFEIRRTRGETCRRVVRPFVAYYELRDPLPPGAYTLRLNGQPYPFEIFPPDPANARGN